jgi:hypothetical protein
MIYGPNRTAPLWLYTISTLTILQTFDTMFAILAWMGAYTGLGE